MGWVLASALHIFCDYACPWSYIGRARMKRALRDVDLPVATIHTPLNPSMPPEGRMIREYLESKGVEVDVASARIRVLMRQEGLPFRRDVDTARIWPTRKAHELAAWAVEQPGGVAIHDALFRASHVDNLNLADTDVLVGIAVDIGLNPDDAWQILSSGAAAKLVDAHYALATRVGVSILPTFMIERRRLEGAGSVEEIRALVRGDDA